ncbi:MAG: hypothetical protein ABW171_14400 [Steroidobacter sp.]
MERGVVVGGLMICGSFLLAASLNRSAVKEAPLDEPVAAQAPLTPTIPVVPVAVESGSTECAPETNSSAEPAATIDKSAGGDLPGNGRESCSR